MVTATKQQPNPQILLNSEKETTEARYPLDVLAGNSKLVLASQVALLITLSMLLFTLTRNIACQIINYKKRDLNLRPPLP